MALGAHLEERLPKARIKDRPEICDDFKAVYGKETKEDPGGIRELRRKMAGNVSPPDKGNRDDGGPFRLFGFPDVHVESNKGDQLLRIVQRGATEALEPQDPLQQRVELDHRPRWMHTGLQQRGEEEKEKYIAELTEEERFRLGFEILA